MKKIILLPVLLFSVLAFSQQTLFSIGPEVALPGSKSGLHMNAGMGLGGSLRMEISGRKPVCFIATIGYLGFTDKELAYSGTPPTITSVKAFNAQAGIKYYSAR